MSDLEDDPLERLSANELYHLARSHALHHLDVKFFWRLLEVMPAAEAAAGDMEGAINDVDRLSSHVDDLADAGHGPVAEALRPFYLEYLHEHHVKPKS